MENYRLKHMEELKKNGINPFGYPLKKRPNITVDDLKKKYKDQQELPNQTFITSGRILNTRHHGKSIFADLLGQQEKIQIYLKKDELDQKFDIFKNNIDNGDWIMVEGFLFRTKTGEITIHLKDYDFLSKCLLELPEKWHGLKNPEIRYRQRYLDLFVNPQVKKNFVIRNKIIKFLRNYLDNLGFIEVETPMLNIIPTGALAKPFKTFHNALGTEMFLRIAPELY
ncbi:MAG: OB-fold nucleic acid binding domain-containing protein, partial [Candidatus Calescibacterium sp.]|nr:OB-fold nucleic acid binding domain-containing protein [Candidatus Calescibacterium sp.]